MKYVVVRPRGIYVFNERLEKEDFIKVELEESEIIDILSGKLPERVKKYIKEDYVFLGQKFEGYNSDFDRDKIRKALDIISMEEEGIDQSKFYIATKMGIAKSITRDQLIIQIIMLLDDINKITNLMVERFREIYNLYLPEVSQMIEDHEKFLKSVIGKRREDLMKEFKIDTTMGGELKDKDVEIINKIGEKILDLYKLRDTLKDYVEELMNEVCPNLSKVATPTIGARLIALAGGLRELAILPSSTIQVLGAEKALFKHLTKGTPPPKHGVIFNHPLIQKLPRKQRGAMARTLASKIAIAAKVDAFTPGKLVYESLIKELEERFNELKQEKK
ncbi:C/D box methylation guide ribonucleoprotein complex aNOP56 subunit [Nanoarchaeota archaeon NZ13-N]|uniref:Nop domain-containing protein n=1 Tax=Candidatus Nanoclepta minutus TaxID=1940235 RepID=A0A397WNN6_9ARCH|nr:MAG: C/D box methylation guide ribonucleoprotein complex aNOP56 subunit [Nanoarchaeota archaeon NZ13-N]RIB35532.1 MAG: hypothetical protein BXU00_00270 [Candidatus Nanoclepta minutus]